eukprot:986159-Rhodomonas_salina.1
MLCGSSCLDFWHLDSSCLDSWQGVQATAHVGAGEEPAECLACSPRWHRPLRRRQTSGLVLASVFAAPHTRSACQMHQRAACQGSAPGHVEKDLGDCGRSWTLKLVSMLASARIQGRFLRAQLSRVPPRTEPSSCLSQVRQ